MGALKNIARRAFSLILECISYPVTVVSIILMFSAHLVQTLYAYTARRIRGVPVTKVTFKVTFD